MEGYASFCFTTKFPHNEGKVVLVKQGGLLRFPGGEKKPEENPQMTALRGVWEEISCWIGIRDVICCKRMENYCFLMYWAVYLGGKYKPGKEIEDLVFVFPSQISALIDSNQLFPEHAKMWTRLIKGPF